MVHFALYSKQRCCIEFLVNIDTDNVQILNVTMFSLIVVYYSVSYTHLTLPTIYSV